MHVHFAKGLLFVASLALGCTLSSCDRTPSSLETYRNYFEKADLERQKAVTIDSPAAVLLPPETLGVADVAWCGDNATLVSSSHQALLVWDVQTRAVLRKLDRASGSRAIACSGNSRLVASGNYDKSSAIALRIWDLKKAESFRDLAGPFPSIESRNDSILAYVAFSPDNRRLFAHYVNARRDQNQLVIYDVGSLRTIRQFSFPGKLEGKPVLNGRGNRYAYALLSLRVVVIDTENGRELSEIALEQVLPHALAFGPQDQTIWIGGRRIQNTYNGKTYDGKAPHVLQEYRLAGQKGMRSIETGHIQGLSGIIFREEADLLITASADKTIEVRHGRSGELVDVYGDKKNPIEGIALRPDGQVVVSAARTFMEVWPLKVRPVQPR